MLILSQEELALFNQRDPKIYTIVYRHFYEHIYHYVCYKTKNETHAKDITTIVFIDLFKSKTQFDSVESIKVWLFWLALKKCIDFWEQEARQKALINELTDQQMDAENIDPQLSNDMQAIDAVIELIKQLPDMQRQITNLYFFSGLTRSEIAEELNTSLNNVTRQLNYSIQKIKNRLGNV